jgi:hypothetical protein
MEMRSRVSELAWINDVKCKLIRLEEEKTPEEELEIVSKVINEVYKELTLERRDNYINELENMGWFDFSDNTKEEIYKRLEKINNTINFSSCLYDICFDGMRMGYEDDSIYKINSYKMLLKKLLDFLKLKKYELNVESFVINGWNKLKIEIKTQQNEYEYNMDMDVRGNWFDSEFIIKYINDEIIEGEGLNKKYFVLPSCEGTIKKLAYIPTSIYEKAKENGIIPTDEDYLSYKLFGNK